MPARGDTKVRRFRRKSKASSRPEIEDVQEPFCGQYRKNMVPLADADPDVAAEWCYEKNSGWGPNDFSHSSNVKAWWQCQYCLRTYKATISNRVGRQSGCPFCANKKVCSDNSLESLFPNVAKDWHPRKNGKLKPSDVIKFSAKRAWWLCSNCSHEWVTAISDRTFQDAGCPACYRARVEYKKAHHVKAVYKPVTVDRSKRISRKWYEKPSSSDFLSLADAYPKIAKLWHPTKNGKWKPSDFAYASGARVWWRCTKGPDHEWQTAICDRTGDLSGCPFCNGKRVSVTNSLKTHFPEIAKEWHKVRNGALTPSQVTSKSEKKVWWQCRQVPEHEWETAVSVRAQGCGCPYCSGRMVLPADSLSGLYPQKAKQWDKRKNGKLTASNVLPSSHRIVFWSCKKGHTWSQSVRNRVDSPIDCWECAGKTRPGKKTAT